MTGTIKAVKPDKGYGFVTAGGSNRDFFFHVRETDLALDFDEKLVGLSVEFDVEQTDKGPRAVGVRAAD